MAQSSKSGVGLIAGAVLAPFAFIGALVLMIVVVFTGGGSTAYACGDDAGLTPGTIPDEPVAGYEGEQLENAGTIMRVAVQLGLDRQAQTIAVMTAMGESTLVNVDYGDSVGPDSRGLFQIRAMHGPLSDRMDPAWSAEWFLSRLAQVEGWQQLEPTLAANAVQRNLDPWHYEQHWGAAQQVVDALAGVGACIGGLVSAEGWAIPTDGPITSPFGWRVDPISGVRKFHNGTDLDGECNDPIWAAGAGTVSRVFEDNYGAWIIEIDHGGGVVSWSVHMEQEGVLVQEGQTVQAGQQIALIGSSGYSTGCHLHFEIRTNEEQVDPIGFLATLGVAAP